MLLHSSYMVFVATSWYVLYTPKGMDHFNRINSTYQVYIYMYSLYINVLVIP